MFTDVGNDDRQPHRRNRILMTSSHYTPVDHDESRGTATTVNAAETEVPSRRRIIAVALFATCVILLFADQNLMAPNLSAIAKDFGFNDEERDRKLGGQIALAFFVVGAPASVMIGSLGDLCNRIALFTLTVGLGETACLLTYFSSGFTQLFICRAVTGLSLGGAIPLIYSILGDLFAADERHAVNAVVSMGSGSGIAIGQGIAGFLGPTFGWRLPFLVVSIPALICALGVFCFVQDPERGGMEAAVQTQKKMENGNNPDSSIDNEGCIEMMEVTRRRASNNEASDHNVDRLGDEDEGPVQVQRQSTESLERNNSLDHDWSAHFRTFRVLISTPTVLLMLLQGGPGCVPWGIVNTYLNDFLSRNRGMTVQVWITGCCSSECLTVSISSYAHRRAPPRLCSSSGSATFLASLLGVPVADFCIVWIVDIPAFLLDLQQ